MKIKLLLLFLLPLLLSSSCKNDDDELKSSAAGIMRFSGVPVEISNGTIEISGAKHTINLSTNTGTTIILIFAGDDEVTHTITSNAETFVTYATAAGEFYESLDGFISITTYQKDGENLSIKGIVEARLVSLKDGSIHQLTDGNFSFSRS